MEKNKLFEGAVIDLNDDGDGIVKIDSEVVFVPDTIKNEKIKGIIINSKSKFAIGKVTELLTTSPLRVTPACPYSTSCGGCTLQHLNYNEQLVFKQNKVANAFKRVAKLTISPTQTVASASFRYRNKIAMPIDPECRRVGLFRTNSHKLVPVDDCIITKDWIKPLIKVVNDFLQKSTISIYNESTKKGLLKHLVAREVNNNILITLVINGDSLPNIDPLISDLKQTFGENFGLNLNKNKLCNNVILTDEFVHIYGLDSLKKTDFGITYPITNASFMQVNDEICEKIYQTVLNNISAKDVVINAYSGAGLLSALISTKAKFVYGIEIVSDASRSAEKLKKDNNINNLINICGDCTKELQKLISLNNINDFTLVVDPPRKGLTIEVVECIKKSMPNKIIYISCNPQTLARDIALIVQDGNFAIESVIPYDMFPETAHVESVCILKKSNSSPAN